MVSKKTKSSRHNVTPTLDTPSSKSLNTPISPLRKKQVHAVNTDAERFKEAFKESKKAQQPQQPNVYYNLFGRAGKIYICEEHSVTAEDLIRNLEPVAENEDNSNWCLHVERGHELFTFGASQYWVPVGASGIASNNLSRLRNLAQKVERLVSLFSGKQYRFSDESMRMLSIFNLHNMNASQDGSGYQQ